MERKTKRKTRGLTKNVASTNSPIHQFHVAVILRACATKFYITNNTCLCGLRSLRNRNKLVHVEAVVNRFEDLAKQDFILYTTLVG